MNLVRLIWNSGSSHEIYLMLMIWFLVSLCVHSLVGLSFLSVHMSIYSSVLVKICHSVCIGAFVISVSCYWWSDVRKVDKSAFISLPARIIVLLDKCLFISLYIFLSSSLTDYPSVYLYVRQSFYLLISLSTYFAQLHLHLSVCLSVCEAVCVCVFLLPSGYPLVYLFIYLTVWHFLSFSPLFLS